MESKSLDSANQTLTDSILVLKSYLGTKASNSKILSIVHSCPCCTRCVNDIKNNDHNNGIDRLYIERHDYVRKKIIDAIQVNFGRLMTVKSEQKINNGTLDIVITYDKILLSYHEKTICIEIKSGQSIDLFQIERYLYESYLLLVVRVPTRDLVPIHQANIASELIEGITSTIQKIELLSDSPSLKVQGEWCKGCTANCEFKKNERNHVAKLEFEEFFKNVNAVTQETVRVIGEEMNKIRDSFDVTSNTR